MPDTVVPDAEGHPAATPRLADAAEPVEYGGDAACWLGRVCDHCGALIEGSRGVPCWRCNTPWEPA
ncbi:MAG TPA: hypothetical protein VFQ74_00530 [Pseudolysinimonas sp.]|nr:hypothetical protein [Pseudolysinimonas sp.]